MNKENKKIDSCDRTQPFFEGVDRGQNVGQWPGQVLVQANRALCRPVIAGQPTSTVLACVVAAAMPRGCIGVDDRARFGDRAAVWTMISK